MEHNIPYKKHILVCTHETCKGQGGEEIFLKLKEKVKNLNLKQTYRPSRVICMGLCGKGPNLLVWPEGTTYCKFSEGRIDDLIEKHLLKDEILDDLLYRPNAI